MTVVCTERLTLRPWRPSDLDQLVGIFAKPEVWHFPFGRGWTAEESAAFLDRKIELWATRGWAEWAVEVADGDRLIGYVGLAEPTFLPEVMPAVEVGWRLDPDSWGLGYATEAARAALAFGFGTLRLDEIVSIHEPANVASGRVMARLGMAHDRDTVHPTLGVPLRVTRLRRAEWEHARR